MIRQLAPTTKNIALEELIRACIPLTTVLIRTDICILAAAFRELPNSTLDWLLELAGHTQIGVQFFIEAHWRSLRSVVVKKLLSMSRVDMFDVKSGLCTAKDPLPLFNSIFSTGTYERIEKVATRLIYGGSVRANVIRRRNSCVVNNTKWMYWQSLAECLGHQCSSDNKLHALDAHNIDVDAWLDEYASADLESVAPFIALNGASSVPFSSPTSVLSSSVDNDEWCSSIPELLVSAADSCEYVQGHLKTSLGETNYDLERVQGYKRLLFTVQSKIDAVTSLMSKVKKAGPKMKREMFLALETAVYVLKHGVDNIGMKKSNKRAYREMLIQSIACVPPLTQRPIIVRANLKLQREDLQKRNLVIEETEKRRADILAAFLNEEAFRNANKNESKAERRTRHMQMISDSLSKNTGEFLIGEMSCNARASSGFNPGKKESSITLVLHTAVRQLSALHIFGDVFEDLAILVKRDKLDTIPLKAVLLQNREMVAQALSMTPAAMDSIAIAWIEAIAAVSVVCNTTKRGQNKTADNSRELVHMGVFKRIGDALPGTCGIRLRHAHHISLIKEARFGFTLMDLWHAASTPLENAVMSTMIHRMLPTKVLITGEEDEEEKTPHAEELDTTPSECISGRHHPHFQLPLNPDAQQRYEWMVVCMFDLGFTSFAAALNFFALPHFDLGDLKNNGSVFWNWNVHCIGDDLVPHEVELADDKDTCAGFDLPDLNVALIVPSGAMMWLDTPCVKHNGFEPKCKDGVKRFASAAWLSENLFTANYKLTSDE